MELAQLEVVEVDTEVVFLLRFLNISVLYDE